jgi:hypothetical protein
MGRIRKERRFNVRFAVLGEGITEQWYLKHLKEYKNYGYAIRPSLFSDIGIEKAEGIIDELVTGGCDHITFLTDYDTIVSQNKQAVFDRIAAKYMDMEEVLICDSMPSIELWFLLHFKYTTKEFTNCSEILVELKKYLPEYEKKRTYLEKIEWFKTLINNAGDEQALANAKRLLDLNERENIGKHFPYTKMPLAIEAFEKHKEVDRLKQE